MKFSTQFPELSENQIKMLVRLIEEIIGKNVNKPGFGTIRTIERDLRSEQRAALHKLIS